MENFDWVSVTVFCAGVALGVAVCGLWICARAWDMGYRAGRLDERYGVYSWRMTAEAQ